MPMTYTRVSRLRIIDRDTADQACHDEMIIPIDAMTKIRSEVKPRGHGKDSQADQYPSDGEHQRATIFGTMSVHLR